MNSPDTLIQTINEKYLMLEHERKKVERKEKWKSNIEKEIETLKRLRNLSNEVATRVQHGVAQTVSSLATDALKILDKPYDLKLNFVVKRGKTEAQLRLFQDGAERHFLYGTGGGVADIASAALRLTFFEAYGDRRRILFFDEPFKHVSRQYQSNLANFFKKYSEEFDVQLFIVTHNSELLEQLEHVEV